MTLEERNRINRLLQESGCTHYEIVFADGVKVVYLTPEYINRNSGDRVRAGLFD
jgi:hypothetical protein